MIGKIETIASKIANKKKKSHFKLDTLLGTVSILAIFQDVCGIIVSYIKMSAYAMHRNTSNCTIWVNSSNQI